MIQGEIEYAFREMKHDLGLRPVYHQLDDRIEAHIFTYFIVFCLLTTLQAMAREHASGLTPRQIIANLKTIKMVDIIIPTTDGRVVTLPRYVEPKEKVALLLNRLGLTLPGQPPPRYRIVHPQHKTTSVVKTFKQSPGIQEFFIRIRKVG